MEFSWNANFCPDTGGIGSVRRWIMMIVTTRGVRNNIAQSSRREEFGINVGTVQSSVEKCVAGRLKKRLGQSSCFLPSSCEADLCERNNSSHY